MVVTSSAPSAPGSPGHNYPWAQQPIDRWLSELQVADAPLRVDLLNLEQLRRHAQLLAAGHRLALRLCGDELLARFEENARILAETHRVLSPAAAQHQEIRPAGVWFLDNYYLIHEQIRMARQHLPRKYSRELPQLAGGSADGLPRVYDLALELISHVDGQINTDSLQQFISAYQEVAPLRLGELWAVPIMLRLALIENLRRVALRIACQQRDQQWGDAWADRILRASQNSSDELLHVINELALHGPALSGAFAVRLAQRLTGHLPQDNLALPWLRQHLAEHGQSLDGLTELDLQHQAADRLSISNSISSLRTLRSLDWKKFVEGQSAVERILRSDPAGVYARMSFASRDHYRHAVESLARRSPLNEEQIAQRAIECARFLPSPDQPSVGARRRGAGGEGGSAGETKHHHVGYYLVDAGRSLLEKQIGYRCAWWESLLRLVVRRPLITYLGAIFAVWMGIVCAAAVIAWRWSAPAAAGPVVVGLLIALLAGAAGQFAVSFVNWLCTLCLRPRPTLRFDFSAGIPPEHRTLVAIPTLLHSERGVRALVDQLEARYLANQDENLLFALLTDLPDADREVLPSDGPLVAAACQGIERLDELYCQSRAPRFFLLHRARRWNEQEGVWMGEERKRGKLAALNHLLRSGDARAFCTTHGDLRQLAGVRYVITLDTDTWLPRDVGRSLVGCIAHPLNRPQVDPATRQVVEGYGILQPRVTVTVPEASRSPFSRLFAGDPGIDPYTNQTSDVYHDAFGQGSFIGKGIYDVQAFEAALAGRFPANRVLSHDLIEGCYARSGLVNDLELFEGFPSRLVADMSRRHRWIRGDWQIAAWLGPRVPGAGEAQANHLPVLARWKIFDNLRRSLSPLFLLGFLLLGWIAAPTLAGLWTLLGLTLVFGPPLISSFLGLVRKPRDKPHRLHWAAQAESVLRALLREAIGWCVLPYTVHCHLDAVVRTLYRIHVSQRKLLEWTAASEAETRSVVSCRDHYELMWACTVTSLGAGAALAIVAPAALIFAGPGLLSWLAGPLVAWWMSRPTDRRAIRLTAAQSRQLGRWARQTWHYFDTWVAAPDHWLPPDNVQENGTWRIAPRTSPTNIGMGLLADLAACDLGYLPPGALLQRCSRTMNTLLRMERYRGHFFNWYDTRTLQPTEPRYVSSVDSGNLWGALIVLRAGLDELGERPLVPTRLVDGLRDTLDVLASERSRIPAWSGSAEFDGLLACCRRECAQAGGTGAKQTLDLLGRLRTLTDALAALTLPEQPALQGWVGALARQCAAWHGELSLLAFWVRADGDAHLAELHAFLASCDAHCTLRRLPHVAEETLRRIAATSASHSAGALQALREAAVRALAAAHDRLRRSAWLGDLCRQFCRMDFRFLLHPEWKLLSIGFNMAEHRRDNSFYDLLASESRLASFLAICDGQLPQEHWFLLGRMVTLADGEPTLLSWSGSMFEYLMPMLLMPSYPATILDLSCRAAVRRQMRYARRHGVPWGISESCYHLTDASQAYRYRAFGVPGLGLDRGLGADLVIAPYASAMAVMLAPREACANLEFLQRHGALSPYGFCDAVDYTSQRCRGPDQPAVCRTVMAHHSGMALVAFCNVLLDWPMVRRFMRHPPCRAHDLLLQERLPHVVRPVNPQTLDTGRPAADEQFPRRPA